MTAKRAEAVAAVAVWGPVVVWAVLITRASGDDFAASRTLFWIEWVVRLASPDASLETVYLVNFVVRKLAHVTEYAIFAVLLVRAFRSGTGPSPRSPAITAAMVAALLSLGDEGRQALTTERTGSLLDCATDSGGAVLGSLAVRRRRNSSGPRRRPSLA